jgi:hypothetical protein
MNDFFNNAHPKHAHVSEYLLCRYTIPYSSGADPDPLVREVRIRGSGSVPKMSRIRNTAILNITSCFTLITATRPTARMMIRGMGGGVSASRPPDSSVRKGRGRLRKIQQNILVLIFYADPASGFRLSVNRTQLTGKYRSGTVHKLVPKIANPQIWGPSANVTLFGFAICGANFL